MNCKDLESRTAADGAAGFDKLRMRKLAGNAPAIGATNVRNLVRASGFSCLKTAEQVLSQ
jgi:hypothetical protein